MYDLPDEMLDIAIEAFWSQEGNTREGMRAALNAVAAPELLASLKLVRNWGRIEDLSQSEVAAIDAAIAKAEKA